MKNFKKLLIILLVILVIVVGIIIYIAHVLSNPLIDEVPTEPTYVYNNTIKELSIRNEYYTVKTCINKFYTYYSAIYNTKYDYSSLDDESVASLEKQKNKSIQATYNMLDEDYISHYNITIDNLLTKLSQIEKMTVNINKMYVSEKDQNINVYFVYGDLVNTSTSQTQEFSMMVKVDLYNETFSLLLGDYINEKYGKVNVGDNLEINYPEKIEENEYNIFDYEIISDETYITDVFNSFRDNMIYNKQVAYESLDEEYRTKRFPTFEEFENYTKNNIRKISVMKLSKYQKSIGEEGIQYMCFDTKDKYYIINEKSTMNCTFILDTYTLDLPQFVEKYNESDDETKVALNLEKIKDAINECDFKYVSKKTDEIFRKNNFKNYSEFENYLKSKFFEENEFEYKKIEQQSNLYVATVIVKNVENEEETKEMKVVMKLTDSTDYTISFSFK